MSLASLSDVKRLLKRTDSTSDADLTAALAVAEAWVKIVYELEPDRTGSQTDVFTNVRQDQVLWLKDPNPTSVTIEAIQYSTYPGPGLFPIDIMNFQVMPNGRVQLYYNRRVAPQGYDTAVGYSLPGIYDRIEVTYTASNSVPAPVRDAVALIAASHWAMSTSNIGNLQSETIGSYTYSRLADGSEAVVIPSMARALLRPYARRTLSARVT